MTDVTVIDVLQAQTEALKRMDARVTWLYRITGFLTGWIIVATVLRWI